MVNQPRKDLIGDDPKQPIDFRVNLAGVSIDWLAAMFAMDRGTVRKRLAGCPELRMGPGGAPLFSVAQAAAYLVKPKIDIASWVKSLRPADLPPYLQSEFWDAQNKRQKWEENAGDLWRTDKVVEVFADVFKLIKETMQLWTDSIERKQGLTGEQRALLAQMTDGLQNDLHKKLIEFAAKKQTPSSLAEMKDIEKAQVPREAAVRSKRPELV